MIFASDIKTKTVWLLLTMALLLLTASGLGAQQRVVRFSAEQMPAGKAMEEVKEQTGFRFVFDKAAFDTEKTVRFDKQTIGLAEALGVMVSGQNADYVVRGKIVAITVAAKPKAIAPTSGAQQDPKVPKICVQSELMAAVVPPEPLPVEEAEPETELEEEPAPEPEPQPEREFPAPYSRYKPLDIYLRSQSAAPRWAVKTNLLYAAAALTPNIAVERSIGRRETIELSGSYSWIGRTDAASDGHKQRMHMILRPEYRHWFCRRFEGHFLGAHAIYARYNVSGHDVPLLFKKEHRYDGYAYGAGLAYGYNLALGKQWGLEFNAGLGYMYMKHDKFSCAKCDTSGTQSTKHYFGPTRAGLTLTYHFR